MAKLCCVEVNEFNVSLLRKVGISQFLKCVVSIVLGGPATFAYNDVVFSNIIKKIENNLLDEIHRRGDGRYKDFYQIRLNEYGFILCCLLAQAAFFEQFWYTMLPGDKTA